MKGLIHPKKVWLEDVDVIYGVIEDKLSYHYIGVEIQLMDNTITLFHCGLPKANIKRALNKIQELAGKNINFIIQCRKISLIYIVTLIMDRIVKVCVS